MAKLIYLINASLDGYVEDPDGRIDWMDASEELHALINDLQRPVGTYLYGRRMYETMAVWETDEIFERSYADRTPALEEFGGIWRGADKVVYSRALSEPATARTRLEREFDPEAVRELKASAAADLSVAGPELAADAFRAGIVDEVQLTVSPVVLGGGKRALPEGVRLDLELADQRRLANGIVYLGYRVRGA